MNKLTELSQEISYVFRHALQEYELEMDEEGWMSKKMPHFSGTTSEYQQRNQQVISCRRE